jgi:hypothetical protein
MFCKEIQYRHHFFSFPYLSRYRRARFQTSCASCHLPCSYHVSRTAERYRANQSHFSREISVASLHYRLSDKRFRPKDNFRTLRVYYPSNFAIALRLRARPLSWFQRRLDKRYVFFNPAIKLFFLRRSIGHGVHDRNPSGVVCH